MLETKLADNFGTAAAMCGIADVLVSIGARVHCVFLADIETDASLEKELWFSSEAEIG